MALIPSNKEYIFIALHILIIGRNEKLWKRRVTFYLALSHFSRRHRPLSQVAHVLFSLCSFYYVRTILSESLAQANMNRYSQRLGGGPKHLSSIQPGGV